MRAFPHDKKTLLLLLIIVLCSATFPNCLFPDDKESAALPQESQPQPPSSQSKSAWSFNGFVDLGYLLGFNHPSNHSFRARGTTFKVSDVRRECQLSIQRENHGDRIRD